MRFKKLDMIFGLGLDMNCNHVETMSTFIEYVAEGYVWYDCIIESEGVVQYADSSDYVKKENL